jgi:hypothetical protein
VASDFGPADLNQDGKTTAKEKRVYQKKKAAADAAAAGAKPKPAHTAAPATGLPQDKLSLRQLYGYTRRQLMVDDGLFDLFQRAWEGQWAKEKFEAEVERLDWFKKNKASVREYQLLAAKGGADFTEKQADAQEFVRQTAMNMGRTLSPEEIQSLAEDSLINGWGESGQDFELKRAIIDLPDKEGEDYGGTIEDNMMRLRATALANGVKIDEKWMMGKAKSAASGLSLIEDADMELREMAAQKVPAFANQIRAGQDLDALISPWRRMMAEEWELSDTAIGMDDPMLMQAIGGYDQSGQPKMEDLGSFQTRLRQDPRWKVTAQGQNKSIDSYSGILKMFGYGN